MEYEAMPNHITAAKTRDGHTRDGVITGDKTNGANETSPGASICPCVLTRVECRFVCQTTARVLQGLVAMEYLDETILYIGNISCCKLEEPSRNDTTHHS